MTAPIVERWHDLKLQSLHSETPREIVTRLIKSNIARYVPIYEHPIGQARRIKATACNILFTDVVQQMQLEGPFHWVDKKGNPMRYRHGMGSLATELSANGLVAWFGQYGEAHAWKNVQAAIALEYAKKPVLVAVTYYNPTPNRSGHIALLLEDGTIAQAGAGMPFVGKPLELGFGKMPVQYWVYVGTSGNGKDHT